MKEKRFCRLLKSDLIVNGHGQHGASCQHDGSDGVQAKPYPAGRGDEAKPPSPVAVQVAEERLVEACPRIIRPNCGQPLGVSGEALCQLPSL